MINKFYITLLYALTFTVWPPDHVQPQEKKDTMSLDKWDSSGFYELQDEKEAFKVLAGTTKNIQKEAIRNLTILEKRKRLIRVDTAYIKVYVNVYDTAQIDTIKHKRNFFQRIFN